MGKHLARFPMRLRRGGMNLALIFRYTILAVSAAAMVLGILVMSGWLVPRYLSSQFGVVFGAVIFLYGLYRFVITFFQKPRQ
jgi:hypothetical protein